MSQQFTSNNEQINEEIDLDVAPLLQSVQAYIETVPKTGPGDNMLPELRLFGTLSTLQATHHEPISVRLKFSATATGIESRYALGEIRMSPDLLRQPQQLDPVIYKTPVEAFLREKANTFMTDLIWDRLVHMEMWRDDAGWDSGDPKVITWDPTSQADVMGPEESEGSAASSDDVSNRSSSGSLSNRSASKPNAAGGSVSSWSSLMSRIDALSSWIKTGTDQNSKEDRHCKSLKPLSVPHCDQMIRRISCTIHPVSLSS